MVQKSINYEKKDIVSFDLTITYDTLSVSLRLRCASRRTDADDLTALDVALLTGNAIISDLLMTHGARAQISVHCTGTQLLKQIVTVNCQHDATSPLPTKTAPSPVRIGTHAEYMVP